MITIRTATELLTLGYLIGLSVYDIRYKRVTNTSLLLLLPAVFLIGITEIRSAGDMLSFLLGGLSGGGILLAAAMATTTGQRQAVSTPQKGLSGQSCGRLRQAHTAHQSHSSR